MIGSLMEFFENFKKTAIQPGFVNEYKVNIYPSWYNTFDFHASKKELQNFIINLYRGRDYKFWGFKEIRIGLESYEKLSVTLDNFRELFPGVKYILLYRENLENQLNSGFWSENKIESRALLTNQYENFKKYNFGNSDSTFLLSMEDMISMNSKFKSLFDFIGFKFNFDNITNILNSKIDYLEKSKTN